MPAGRQACLPRCIHLLRHMTDTCAQHTAQENPAALRTPPKSTYRRRHHVFLNSFVPSSSLFKFEPALQASCHEIQYIFAQPLVVNMKNRCHRDQLIYCRLRHLDATSESLLHMHQELAGKSFSHRSDRIVSTTRSLEDRLNALAGRSRETGMDIKIKPKVLMVNFNHNKNFRPALTANH